MLLPLPLPPPQTTHTGVGVSDNPGAMYNTMHAYLAGSAVDGVKVDCQVGGMRRGHIHTYTGTHTGCTQQPARCRPCHTAALRALLSHPHTCAYVCLIGCVPTAAFLTATLPSLLPLPPPLPLLYVMSPGWCWPCWQLPGVRPWCRPALPDGSRGEHCAPLPWQPRHQLHVPL